MILVVRVSLLDAERLINVNRIKEVTSASLYATGTKNLFDPHGVLSDQIFGLSRKDRRSKYAYVDLVQPFIHPHIYKAVLSRMFSKITSIVSGIKTYSIKDGVVVEDPNGWTGLVNLYKNWDYIDWAKSD